MIGPSEVEISIQITYFYRSVWWSDTQITILIDFYITVIVFCQLVVYIDIGHGASFCQDDTRSYILFT